jgi:hypothetical protein
LEEEVEIVVSVYIKKKPVLGRQPDPVFELIKAG